MPTFDRWRGWARALKRETLVMYVALGDARTPWYAKAAAGCVVAYALSPVDLIPDPIPVLGYLDDLILIPLGIWLVRRLIPAVVLADSRARVESEAIQTIRIGLLGAAVIILLWVAMIGALVWGALKFWPRHAAY